MTERPFLFDATRLISRSWTARRPTGIDRVCYAYLDRFGAQAQAVVQHRGMFRVLTPRHSDMLFDLLAFPDTEFRRGFMSFAPRALAQGVRDDGDRGAIYINVSHTDFDLPSHVGWAQRSGVRPVYLIHDLIPLTHSEYCRPRAVRRHRGRVINALHMAAGIIVNSRATEQELIAFARRERLPLPPTLAAPLAGAALNRRPRAGTMASTPPYFVCVGTIEGRKNHIMLLQLWRRLAERMGQDTPRLLIIGQWGVQSEAVRAMLRSSPQLHRHVSVMNRCGDEELGDWIAGAQALLMPTLAEGFGLPLVEALRLGTPVIASDLPCFREIGQGIPAFMDPFDIIAWEELVCAFAHDHPERQRQLQLMPTFRPQTWDDHFQEVANWFGTLPQPSPARAPRPAAQPLNAASAFDRAIRSQ